MLVAFSGCKGAGKDTCADYLVNFYGFVKVSFANPLKTALKEFFLLRDDQLYGTLQQKEEPDPRWYGASPRTIMQYVGTDLFRDQMERIMPGIGKNIHIHRFKLWYEAQIKLNPNLRVVISDLRFVNEGDYIRHLGGTVIEVNRFQIIPTDLHPSETEFKLITEKIIINNNGTKSDLYAKLDTVVECL